MWFSFPGPTLFRDTTPGVTFTYDRLGRQTQVTVGTNSTASLIYNDAGQLLAQTNSGGTLAGLQVTNGYDQYLRRAALAGLNSSTPKVQLSFSYDAASRLQRVTDATGATNYSATYSYLANSPLVGQIAFTNSAVAGMTTTKQYDYLNRLTQVSSASSAQAVASFNYGYNSANQRIRATLADGSYWLYTYDSLGQVIAGNKYWPDETPVAGQQFDYGFDTIGNRTSTLAGGDQNGANLRSASYGANSLNQYTNRTVPGAVDVMGLELATNSVTVNGTTAYRKGEYFRQQLSVVNTSSAVWQSVTNAAPNETTIVGSIFVPKTPEQFGYDADGNLTSDGRWNYTWDAENRLVGLAANNAGVGPQTSLKFEYDWQGRRIHKQVWPNTTWNGSPTNDVKFLYDGWNPVAQLNTSNNNVLQYYVWGSDLSGSMQRAGGVGSLLELSDTVNGVHFVAYDGNGNVAGMAKASDGTMPTRYEYGPFGEVIRATGPMAKANPFRFSTKYDDDETDFLYYGYRYYNPSTGRWLSRDPIGEGDGLNLYGLVHNSPMNAIDYLGLVCECAFRTTIKPGDKINKLEEGILVFGHHFDVDIDIDYIKGEGLATLEWWEQTDNVPLEYGNLVKPNVWADLNALFPASMFTALKKWASRDTSSLGTRTVVLSDDPVLGAAHLAVSRVMKWDIRVKNPDCCSCNRTKFAEDTAKQTLAATAEHKTITEQRFDHPGSYNDHAPYD